MATPYCLIRLSVTSSTQDDARRAYRGRPVVVVADRQDHGRGRREREWISAPGALAVSVAFQPRWDGRRWGLLPLMAGWQAARVLGARVVLKWPNDLLVGDDKVGGVLVEARGSVVVAGCGFNLWWPDPPRGMAGLDDQPPPSLRREDIAHAWAGGVVESALDPDGGSFSLDGYRRRCVTIGQWVSWAGGGAGRAVDIDPEGALVVEGPSGRRRLRSEEVFHVRATGDGI